MYFVYAVRETGGEKERSFVGAYEREFLAKHAANVATCNGSDYAYVKAFGGGTIFFIRRPDYDEGPADQSRLRPQPVPQHLA